MIPLQYVLFCAGSFSTFQSGLNLGWSSYALPQLLRNDSTIPLTNNEGSWVASTFLIGAIFGSILTGLTIDIFGRRTLLLVTSFPLIGTWLLIAYAQTPWDLYLARFVAGVSDGVLLFCLPLYLAEICQPKIRGFLISGTIVVLFFGTFMSNVLGAIFSSYIVAITSAILSLVPVLLYLLIPESPQFYLIRGKSDRAKISMDKFNRKDNADVLLNLIKNTLIEEKTNKRKLWKLLADVDNLRTLGLMIGLSFFHQMSGFLGITFYIETLFKETEASVSPILLISAYYLLQIAVAFVNAILIDKVGRRPLLLTSMFFVVVGLLLVTVFFVLQHIEKIGVGEFSWLPIFGFFVFIIGYTVGLETVPIVLSGEIFSLNFKACATGILNVVFGIIGTAISKFFQYTKDEYGIYVPFLTFTICSTCGLAFIYFFVPETKKKTLEEIQTWLKAKSTPRLSAN